VFFFSGRRRHTRFDCDWSSDVCSSDLLDQLEPERARFIAAFGYILGRVANADLKISPEETRAMERIIKERGGLPEEQALIVVQRSEERRVGKECRSRWSTET